LRQGRRGRCGKSCFGRRRTRRLRGSRLAGAGDVGNRLPDGDLGAVALHDLCDAAVVETFQFHDGLVGLDLGQDVAFADGVALLDLPPDNLALLHAVGEPRHDDFVHGSLLRPGALSVPATLHYARWVS